MVPFDPLFSLYFLFNIASQTVIILWDPLTSSQVVALCCKICPLKTIQLTEHNSHPLSYSFFFPFVELWILNLFLRNEKRRSLGGEFVVIHNPYYPIEEGKKKYWSHLFTSPSNFPPSLWSLKSQHQLVLGKMFPTNFHNTCSGGLYMIYNSKLIKKKTKFFLPPLLSQKKMKWNTASGFIMRQNKTKWSLLLLFPVNVLLYREKKF